MKESGRFEDGTYIPNSSGNLIIEVSAGSAKSYALVNVSNESEVSINQVLQNETLITQNNDVSNENITPLENISQNKEIQLPKDIKGPDKACKAPNDENENSIKIAIYDAINKPVLLIDQFKNLKIENELNKNADIIMLTSSTNQGYEENIVKPVIRPSSYGKTSYENTDIITLDVSNGGLRNTDYSAWINLKKNIETSSNKNILILMKGTLESFSDADEKKLFIDYMCDLRRNNNKNIWIINDGVYTDYSMERGVKYLSVNNNSNNEDCLENVKNTSYILITIDKNEMSYEIKNIL